MKRVSLLLYVWLLAGHVAHAEETSTGARYTESYNCGVITVVADGKKCIDEYSCPHMSNHLWERVTIKTGESKTFPVKPLHESFKNSNQILRDEGTPQKPLPRLYIVKKVSCLSANEIGILYFSDGNCSSGCENYVTYTIEPKLGITDESLSK